MTIQEAREYGKELLKELDAQQGEAGRVNRDFVAAAISAFNTLETLKYDLIVVSTMTERAEQHLKQWQANKQVSE